MKGYILAIAGVVLLSAVVAVISPSGKMGKFVKGMVKLIGLVILITPFVSFFRGDGFSFESQEQIQIDESYLESSAELMSDADEREIAGYLSKKFGILAEINCIRNTDSRFSVKSLQVKILDFGINAEDEHINIISQIRSELNERYGCDTEIL